MASIRNRVAKLSKTLERLNGNESIYPSQDRLDWVEAYMKDCIEHPELHPPLTDEECEAIMKEVDDACANYHMPIKKIRK